MGRSYLLDDCRSVGYAQGRMRGVVVVLAALALLGCKKEPAFRYQLVFDKASPIRDGGRLFLGDRELGTVERPLERASTGPRMAVVSFTLGQEDARLSERDDLALRYPTPCGLSAPLPVQIAELDEREDKLRAGTHPNIKFVAEVKGDVPAAVELWIDRSEGASKVTVGEAVLPTDAEPARLFDVGCAEAHGVTIDGVLVGQIAPEGVVRAAGADEDTLARERSLASGIQKRLAERTDSPVPQARYLLGRPGRCYRARLVVYVRSDEADIGGDRRIYEGRRLYQLFHRPEFFLEPAPSTKTSAEASVLELLPVDCDG